MRFAFFFISATAAAATASLSASAQEAAPADRPAVALSEVERGVYTGGEAGFLFLELPGGGKGLGTGAVVGVDVGFDFSRYFGIGIFALAASVQSPNGYTGLGPAAGPGGDFSGVLPGLEARLHLPLGADSNGVERVFFDVGVGGGYMFLTPSALFAGDTGAPAAKASLRIEYFTHLRHFSFGLAVEGLAVLPSGGQILGGDVSPFVRYSF